MERLYSVTYDNEEDEMVTAIVPEWMLPEIETIHDIEVVGNLVPGYCIVEDDDDPGEKDPKPVLLVSNEK